jgi:hypothetical protein
MGEPGRFLLALRLMVFKPHWIHRGCGGVIAGTCGEYLCDKCRENAPAIGAEIPVDVENRREYFACHPELEVALLRADELARARELVYDLR